MKKLELKDFLTEAGVAAPAAVKGPGIFVAWFKAQVTKKRKRPIQVSSFAPLGFEAQTWDEVLSFVKFRPIVDYREISRTGYNKIFAWFGLGEENPAPRKKELVIEFKAIEGFHGYTHSPEVLFARKILRAGALVDSQEKIRVPALEVFQWTTQKWYIPLESYWKRKVMAEVHEEEILTLIIEEREARVVEDKEVVIKDIFRDKEIRRFFCPMNRLKERIYFLTPYYASEYRDALDALVLQGQKWLRRIQIYGVEKRRPPHGISRRIFRERVKEYKEAGYPPSVAKRKALAEREAIDADLPLWRLFYESSEEVQEIADNLNRLLKECQKEYVKIVQQIEKVIQAKNKAALERWQELELKKFCSKWERKVDRIIHE